MALTRTIRIATRNLARAPGFTTLAALTLGLGIGMSVAVWSVVDTVLVEPLPYPDADRLVQVQMTEPASGPEGYPMSALDYLDYAQRNHTFTAMAATFRENLNLTGGASPERVSGTWVSASFFSVMGVAPRLGRGFGAADDAPGRDLVAVISHGLWQRRFGGSPGVLGRTVTVNGRSHVIVGVTPKGFDYPSASDIWLPIAIDPATEDRHHGWVVPVGRLRPNASLDAARADLGAIAEQLRHDYPDSNARRGVDVVPLKETEVGAVRPPLLLLLGGVACVLLIAAANVTILLSVRVAARQRELAVRHALGASRRQLVALVLSESVILAVLGGAAGFVLAQWGTGAMARQIAALMPHHALPSPDAGMLGCAILLAAAVGLLTGILPAARLREDRIMAQLRESDRSVRGGRSRLGTAMVVAEIALSVVLLTGAALLLRTFVNLLHVDPGFESRRVLTAEVALTGERYAEGASRIEFLRRAVGALRALPGVAAAGSVYPLPLFGRRVTTVAEVEGAPAASAAERPLVELRFVTPGYLEAIGLHLVAGRFIDGSDTADSAPVVVVNETFVRRLCPPGDVVGRRTTGDDPANPDAEWQSIVGVVADVHHIDLATAPGPEMYIPVTQMPFEWATFVVRARSGGATALANPVRDAIRRLDPDLPVFNVQPLTEVVRRSVAGTRVVTSLLMLFAGAGLALAGVGVFAVVSYSVGRRVHEVAVRMSLGGTPTRIVALMVRQGLAPVATGLALGVACALALMRVLASRLYGVEPHDVASFAATVALILAIAALAAWLPARRAARVEPMVVLRSE